MRKRTKEVARLAAEKGYRLQREHPSSGDFWLWGHVHTEVPLVVGSLETIEAFFALDEDHQMEVEGNASYAMREGLTALAALRGPHAVDELSMPALETAALYDEKVKGYTTNDIWPNLARERGEFELYEAVGPERYAGYLSWRQTYHSYYQDETGQLRHVVADARGEALPSRPTEFDELKEILGAKGYEVWRNLPPPPPPPGD
jgi:hypothetical protein